MHLSSGAMCFTSRPTTNRQPGELQNELRHEIPKHRLAAQPRPRRGHQADRGATRHGDGPGSNEQLAAASEPDALYSLSLGDSLAVGAQPIGGTDSGTAADEAGYHQQIGGTVDPLGVVEAVDSDVISSTNRHTNRDLVDQPQADPRARRCSTPAPTDPSSAA